METRRFPGFCRTITSTIISLQNRLLPLRSSGISLSTPANMQVKADISVDKGAECLGQSHLFFMNFLTVECRVSQL